MLFAASDCVLIVKLPLPDLLNEPVKPCPDHVAAASFAFVPIKFGTRHIATVGVGGVGGVAVGTVVLVAVAVFVGVAVRVDMAVLVLVGVLVCVGVLVLVEVAVFVGVAVRVGVAVFVGVLVRVGVAVFVGVLVRVGVAVFVGVGGRPLTVIAEAQGTLLSAGSDCEPIRKLPVPFDAEIDPVKPAPLHIPCAVL